MAAPDRLGQGCASKHTLAKVPTGSKVLIIGRSGIDMKTIIARMEQRLQNSHEKGVSA